MMKGWIGTSEPADSDGSSAAFHPESCGGGNRTRSLAAYEAAAFPVGYSAVLIGEMARRLGAAPSRLSFGGSAALAGARRVEMKNGAVSRRRLIGRQGATVEE